MLHYYPHDFRAIALEQADIAIDHINTKEPYQARIATILIDNVYELFCQVSALHEINNFRFHERDTQKFKKADKLIRESKFEQGLDYLKEMGFLTSDDAKMVLCLHRNRNQSFHKGRIDERLEKYIAYSYMTEVCVLADKISIPNYFGSRKHEETSFRVKKYVGAGSIGEGPFKDSFKRIFSMIPDFKSELKEEMLSILSEEKEYIEEYVSGIESCGGNIPKRFEVECQIEILRETGEMNRFMIGKGHDIEILGPLEYRKKFKELYNFEFNGNIYNQIDQLKGRIRSEEDYKKSFIDFSDFIYKIRLVKEGVTQWLMYAEQEVENQMELMREEKHRGN